MAIVDRSRDEHFMGLALALAERGASQGEVPVGAVLVADGKVLGEGFNCPIASHDPSAHAEMVAIRQAAARLNNYRLPGTTLYVTLEPCSMCAGLMVHARIGRLVFATREPRAGAVVSQMRFFELPQLNHQVQVEEGLLAEQAAGLLKRFFQARRR